MNHQMRPIREVAELIQRDPSTIRRWCEVGLVPAERRYGKLWYVDMEVVITYANRRKGKA